MRIAIAGSTGTVGRHVTAVARERGHEVVGLSRASGVDLTDGGDRGRGLATRLAGVDAVIDVLGTPAQNRAAATAFFTGTTAALHEAEQAAGVGHHVLLSIVGIEQVPTGYYRAKLAQEEAVTRGPVPWSLLRSAQFTEFAEQALGFVRVGRTALVPRMRIAPVPARTVAAALVDAVEAGPGGRLPDLVGPARHDLVRLARAEAAVHDPRLRVIGVRMPGRAGRAMRSGALCGDAG